MKGLRENLGLKAASLALAVGVWFYVRGEERPVMIVPVPLELQGLSSDLTIAGDVIESVNVRVKAPEIVLKALTPEKMSARVDLSSLVPGDQIVRIRRSDIRIPPGVEVVKLVPEYLPLRLERKHRRELPVKARIAGEPAPGYVVGGASTRPAQVAVEGPESDVRLCKEVLTDVVRIDGRAGPLETLVSLYPDRSGVRVIREAAALLTVDIHERFVTRVLQHVRVVAEGAEGRARPSPETVEVTLEGPPGALAVIEPVQVTAVVDLGRLSLRPGEYRLKPRIVIEPESLASRVQVKSTSAEEVTVRILRGRAP